MLRRCLLTFYCLACGLLVLASDALAQAPQVTGFSPTRYSMNNAATVGVSVQFDSDINPGTVNAQTFLVYGERTGYKAGSYNAGAQSASFSPDSPFEPGERVTIILTTGIQSAGGIPMTTGFAWEFYIRTTAATGKFSLDSTYATDRRPNYVAVADINSDTHLDLVSVNSNDNNVTSFFNLGNGDFSENETPFSGELPRAATLADFDGDGDVDLAVVNETDRTITIFNNNGDGAFSSDATLGAGLKPVFVTHGDFDADGFMDLVVVNQTDNQVGVYLNNGSGGFQAPNSFGAGAAPEIAFVADFDNTGTMDIVVSSTDNHSVVLLLNNGAGGFEPPTSFDTDLTPRGITGHDFDGDGFIDVATSNRDGNNVSVLINNGGSFAAASNVAAGLNSFSVSAADLDGDNDADITVSNATTNDFNVLINDGTGAFTVDSTYAVGNEPRALNVGDFNNDGRIDIAVTNRNDDNMSIYFNGVPPVVNDAPQIVTLNTPADRAFLNPSSSVIVLNWDVPTDADGDPLHFLVEVSESADFSSTVVSVDSRNNTAGFSPVPPVAQTVPGVSYTVSTNLADGPYWWRVTAHDGTVFGPTSGARKFTVDANSPTIDEVRLTNPEPMFAPNWYNQNQTSAVDLVMQYDEMHADRATFNLGALGGTQTNINLASGQDQTTQVTVNINGAADGAYTMTTTVVDSANNQASGNTTIALDGTPPTDTRASSPAVSQETTFTVNWGGGSDGDGSGLSGRYDVRFRVNGSGDWTNWLIDFSGVSSQFTGVHGNTYAFEAAAHDNVGNLEVFAFEPETVTEIDTVNDVTAPPAPISLSANGANPSPWQSSPNFNISWQNPADETGIARAFYKLGPPPAANDDTTASVSDVTSFVVEATQENGENLYLWLQDNAGNSDVANISVVNLRYDATPPQNTIASSVPVSDTMNFTVSWAGTGTDGSGSGLAGVYDVRFNQDGGPFSILETGFTGTSIEFEGEDGHTYGFEVAAHDVAGNVEFFTGIAETTTEVDTTETDVTAPGPPTELVAGGASPSPWQRMPQFIVTWQAPQDPSGIQAAFYKLGAAPGANSDTTGSVRSGSSVVVQTTAENGQDLYLWFQDQRGNVDFRNAGRVTLRFDGTPPQIFELDFENGDYFPGLGIGPLAWYNAENTNVVEFLLEYDELHTRTVLVESADLDTTINVANVQSGSDIAENFQFDIGDRLDGLYQVKVTVTDSAGNAASDSSEFAIDTKPPIGASASSPDTSKQENFNVSWSTGSDGDGSGVSGAYTVRYQEDGGSWQTWLSDFQGTSSTFEGSHGVTYAFEVAAHDNVGNIEVLNEFAETSTVVDTGFSDAVLPTIEHTPLQFVDQGRDTTIIAKIQDNSEIVEALLFFKRSNETSFSQVPMVSTGGDTFKAAITAAQVSTIGINYFIRASDGNNITFFPENWETEPFNLLVRITGTDNKGLVKPTAQPSGSNGVAYRMVSVPLSLDDRDAETVLEDDLGTYDPKKWRLFQFQTSSGTYNEFPRIGEFKPGAAMWLIVNEPNKTISSGVGKTVESHQPFEITLSEGWNDISNPFTFPVGREQIQVVSGSASDIIGPYTYQDQWQLPSNVNTLEPWEGYSFFSRSDGVRIAIYPTPISESEATTVRFNALAEPDWFLGIEAYAGELYDRASQIGVAATAAEEWDGHDYLQPPYISDFVSVRFRHEDWQTLAGVFKTDFRPPTDAGHVWTFEVATTLADESVELRFNNLNSLPEELEVILLDKATYKQIDLRKRESYSFTTHNGELTREFDLVIGAHDYVKGSDAIRNPLPDRFSLSQNYPNPFNAGTTILYEVAEASDVSINVHNLLGQRVRQLVAEEKQPGVYRVQWDGRDDGGIALSTGVYFIRLQAGKFQQIRKVVYVR